MESIEIDDQPVLIWGSENHRYDYSLIDTVIEERVVNHILKFLLPETILKLQYPMSTISGSFRGDIALINKGKVLVIECDGKENHTKTEDEIYDEWRDFLILVERKADVIYRVTGADIYYNMNQVLSIISFFNPEFFNQEQASRLRINSIKARGYIKVIELPFEDDECNKRIYNVEVKRKDVNVDYLSGWSKYVKYSLLFPGKKIKELVQLQEKTLYDSLQLDKMLIKRFPELSQS